MSDPFTFDESRVVFEPNGNNQICVYYPAIWGKINAGTIHKQSFERSKELMAKGQMPTESYRWKVKVLEVHFRQKVASLTAHEKLAWMAAHRKENPHDHQHPERADGDGNLEVAV